MQNTRTFGKHTEKHLLSPVVIRGIQSTVRKSDPPHSACVWIAILQSTRSWELSRQGSEQDGAVLLCGQFKRLIAIICHYLDVVNHCSGAQGTQSSCTTVCFPSEINSRLAPRYACEDGGQARKAFREIVSNSNISRMSPSLTILFINTGGKRIILQKKSNR